MQSATFTAIARTLKVVFECILEVVAVHLFSVQRFAHELDARLVAYLNLDTIVDDQDALASSMHPLLARLLFDAARRLTQPDARQSADVSCPPTRPPSVSSVFDWM